MYIYINQNYYQQATHSENATITYKIDINSIEVDPSLANVRETAFTLNSVTGSLLLNIQPTASMHGMFEFNVLATDPGMYLCICISIFLSLSLSF